MDIPREKGFIESEKGFIERAQQLAIESVENGTGPFGCCITDRDYNLVAEGHNRVSEDIDPTAHAEIVALRQASSLRESWRLDDHTLVVTLEPCAMCAGAIAQSRIKTLVFGAWDEKAGAVGSVWDVLRDPRSPLQVEVISGVLEVECSTILQEFFKAKR